MFQACCLCNFSDSGKSVCINKIRKDNPFRNCGTFITDLNIAKKLPQDQAEALKKLQCDPALLSYEGCQVKAQGGSQSALCPSEPVSITNIASILPQTPADYSVAVDSTTATPTLGVPIPGVNFTSPKMVGEYIYVPFLGEYISGAYRYAIGIGAIIAIIMVVYGGFRYLIGSAAGDVKRGKTIIIDAIAGLIIILSAYLILHTINPDTLIMDTIKVPFVVPEDDHSCDDPGECPAPPKERLAGVGGCVSDKALNQQKRKADINFSLFGVNDNRTSKKRTLKSIKRVVIHNGGYTAKGNSDTWTSRKASAHYTIDRNGTIYQHIGEECVAWHAGSGANTDSIGIELNIDKADGKSCNSLKGNATADQIKKACEPTRRQYDSLKTLLNDIVARTSVQITNAQIVGHCEVGGSGGHGDPRAFDWDQIGLSSSQKQSKLKEIANACSWYLPLKQN